MNAKVYIVGAGPGDPELLTLKAYHVLKRADVVLYDRLVHEDILKMVKAHCRLIYVGKSEGNHLIHQEDIQKLMVQHARENSLVVRLKGGHPFVFGRGSEEAQYLKQHGIEFEIIPGITSAITVPAYAGIPLTHRGLSSSFAVITGHDAHDGNGVHNWHAYAQLDTLVFLMSVKKSGYIAQQLLNAGKNPQTPAAFISHGTTLAQSVYVTTLEKLSHVSKEVTPPALLVVGEVVRLRSELAWFKENKTTDPIFNAEDYVHELLEKLKS